MYRNDPRQILYNFSFFVRELQFFQFSMNSLQRWKIRQILSVVLYIFKTFFQLFGWESEKKIFQIQCQVHRSDPRQILYNFDFFVRELKNLNYIYLYWREERKKSLRLSFAKLVQKYMNWTDVMRSHVSKNTTFSTPKF